MERMIELKLTKECRMHEYQRFAAQYIKEHTCCAVLLDMGLGKTVITLTALRDLLFDSFEVHKVLVIAPLRVARDVWADEIRKWDHLKDLRYSVVVGTEKQRKAALAEKADIYIINRENVYWLAAEHPFDFDTVVIDELSSFKCHQTRRFKALMRMRPKVRRVIGLTGTPSSNGLMDLWAEFKLLDMGHRLGRFIGQYRSNYFTADKCNGHIVYSYRLLPGAEQQIYDKLADITISMKAVDHLNMPELVSTECVVRMTPDEKKQYNGLKKDMVLGEIVATNAAALSGKLCQMANGAVYDEAGVVVHIHDHKLDALADIIEAANGKPVLVAYWFKHDLARIQSRFDVVKLDSIESIRAWNAGQIPVAVIHPASAGHGLNLQSGGSNLVFFSLTWSLELYEQTIARLWRQGQRKNVVVQHIITEGTIDVQIMKALREKSKTQAALIDAVKVHLGGIYA